MRLQSYYSRLVLAGRRDNPTIVEARRDLENVTEVTRAASITI